MDKNIKILLEKEYQKVWGNDTKMFKYCMNKTSNAVLLHNGVIFTFDKPSIETSFCFGYDNDDESYNNANNMVENTMNDYSYFIERNMRHFDDIENALKEIHLRAERTYSGKVNITSYIFTERTINNYYISKAQLENMFFLTEEDVEKIKVALEEEKNKFKKRLTTYLNKYGTSKLKVWSYWRD